jgi:hypothetical protein
MTDNPNFNVNDEFGAFVGFCPDPSDPTLQTRVIIRKPAYYINVDQTPILDVAESAIRANTASLAFTSSVSILALSASNAAAVEYISVLNKPTLVSSSTQIQLSNISGTTFGNYNFTFPQDVSVLGTLRAQTLVISSSALYSSGSTKFGDSLDDTHQFTGSLTVFGSISGALALPVGTVSSSQQINTGSFSGSITFATDATFAQTASYIDGGFY